MSVREIHGNVDIKRAVAGENGGAVGAAEGRAVLALEAPDAGTQTVLLALASGQDHRTANRTGAFVPTRTVKAQLVAFFAGGKLVVVFGLEGNEEGFLAGLKLGRGEADAALI
jgi:hypothetical protein